MELNPLGKYSSLTFTIEQRTKKTRACVGADRNAESTQEIVAEVKCQ